MAQPFVETYMPDDLIAGSFPIETQTETIASGETIERGAVLGRVTATKKLKVSVADAEDGSETPLFIAIHDLGELAADLETPVYKAGAFRSSRLVLGEGHTPDSVRVAFDGTPITLV